MKQRINIIEAAMKYRQIILSFVIVGMSIGVIALMNMPRNEFPEFVIRQGVIVGIYPGASSQEVEEQLTKVVENYIFGYAEVNKVKTYSNSSEGQMMIFVELKNNVKNTDQFWSKLRHGLDELKMQLPAGVLALVGTNDFGDTSALLITMSSDEKSYRELAVVMKKLESEVRKIEMVSKIKRYGEQQEKIFIYVQQEKLNEYNIDPMTILASFKLQESLNYAGALDNGEIILPVHLPPLYESEKDISEQIVYSDPLGNILRLKDIARIERKYEAPCKYIRNNGNNALLLSLEMQKGNNIVHFGEEVSRALEQFQKEMPKDVKLSVISNQPQVVQSSITHFMKEFVIAILAVVIVTMILLPFRVATVAGITIPICILITMGIMQAVGIQLDIVSLAGLIIVLGMVVDNAIVVIDNHVEKLDHGETPWNAAWKASSELVIPILSATGAIIASFMPLMLFLGGMPGDFIGSFPITIAIALGISLIVAIILVPLMCYIFIKKGLHIENKKTIKPSILDRVQKIYDRVLEWTFKHAKTTIGLGLLSVILAIAGFSTIDQKMFPEMDRMQFAVEVYLPEGSPLESTEAVIDSLEKALLADARVSNVASFIGNGSPRFNTLYAPHMPAKNYGQIIVNTTSNNETIKVLHDFDKRYDGAFPSAHIKWKQIAMESFVAPIEVRITGNTIDDLKTTADQVSQILKDHKSTTWVRNDWLERRQSISVELDRQKANKLGYSKPIVAATLMTSLEGLPLTTIWEGDYPVSVILSKEEHLSNDIKDLKDQQISSPLTTESLPLRSISTLKPMWTEGNIAHRNGVRTITVRSDIKNGIIYSNVFNEVRPQIDNLTLPPGVEVTYGGEVEGMIENYVPMGKSSAVSIVIIFFILMLQFKTIRRSLLIMSTMLLSLFGVVVGLKLIGYPFGFTSFIGIIGLMGITIRNGIILIDYAMKLVKHEGLSYKEAGLAAGKRRMRPIFLTSMAAAIGVVPMIASGSSLWGPLGTVICFGLLFGMVLTLLILPALYWKSVGREKSTDKQANNELTS